MRVLAEVLFARINGTELRFQVARFRLASRRGDPDEVVRRFADRRLTTPDALRVVHSTSWRYEAGAIVLSYLVYSDRLPFRGRSRRVRLRALPDPEGSADGRDGDRAVASHALRHLAFLAAQDPREYEAKLSAATRRSLKALRPAAAGRVQHTSASEE
jgi:hypothetical protein